MGFIFSGFIYFNLTYKLLFTLSTHFSSSWALLILRVFLFSCLSIFHFHICMHPEYQQEVSMSKACKVSRTLLLPCWFPEDKNSTLFPCYLTFPVHNTALSNLTYFINAIFHDDLFDNMQWKDKATKSCILNKCKEVLQGSQGIFISFHKGPWCMLSVHLFWGTTGP